MNNLFFRKHLNNLRSFSFSLLPKNVSRDEFKKNKLIMTLLVKNEIDIIVDNIEYHLKQGVDFIIATDNGSTDSTLEILKSYEKKGVLFLIQEPSKGYEQAKWVNRMGRIAYENFNANMIFHCDADEFWCSSSGNLKNELLSFPKIDALKIKSEQIILSDKNGSEKYPEDAIYAVRKHTNKKKIAKISNNVFLTKNYNKVFFKTCKGLLDVTMGNHKIVDPNYKVLQKYSNNIKIYHFPSRGKDHFYRKAINGGKSIDQTKGLAMTKGTHWRAWYEAYQNGQLDNEYKSMILSEKDAQKLKKMGILKENIFFPDNSNKN